MLLSQTASTMPLGNSMTKIKFSVPKYQRIGEALITEILEGTWQVNQFLPTEKILCSNYNVSRFTAREALKYVENSGLVERRQGSGTKVVSATMPDSIDHYVSSIQDLLNFGKRTRFTVSHIEEMAVCDRLSKIIKIKTGEQCIHLSGVRLAPHKTIPICYSHLYKINQQNRISAGFKDKDTAVFAIIKALDVSKVGVIEQEVKGGLLSADIATELAAKPGDAALEVTRRYYAKANKELILASVSTYPADRITLTTRFEPE